MADPVLHIKDSYYFEVPKVLYPYDYTGRQQFPDVWISLDEQFQDWEAERLLEDLGRKNAGLPPKEKTIENWHHWVHADHANFAKPLREFFNEKYQGHLKKLDTWKQAEVKTATASKDGSEKAAQELDFEKYLSHLEAGHDADQAYLPFLRWMQTHTAEYQQATHAARNIAEWKADKSVPEWN